MTTQRPKPWKMSLLTWLCIYPLINVLSMLLLPLVERWNPFLRTLLLSLILVPLMGLLLGVLQQRFKTWLER